MWISTLVLALTAQVSVIQGEVRNTQSHTAIPFARVTLSSARTTIDWQYTDQSGRFRFGGLPGPGYYLLSVDHPSYNTAELDGASLMLALQALIRIELVPREKVPSGFAQVVSVAELLLPKDARKEFDRARTYVQRQECAKAVSHFEKGLRFHDKYASAHHDLGICYRKLGRLGLAEQSFLKAAALSGAPEIAVNLADLYSSQRRYKEAETVLVEAIRRYPDEGDLYHALATVHFEQGRDDEAEELGQQAHLRKHGIADVHLLLAKIHLKRRNLEGVADQLEIYLREAPVSPTSNRIRQDLEKYRDRP